MQNRKFQPNYPVAPPHVYLKPWLEPPKRKDEASPGGFTFRVVVGMSSRQIFLDGHSYPCRRIVLVAPDADFSQANTQSIFYAIGGTVSALDNASELPPGTSETLNINDVNKLWLLAQNNIDIIFGRVEA